MRIIKIDNRELLFKYKTNANKIIFSKDVVDKIILENIEVDLNDIPIKFSDVKYIEIRNCIIKGINHILISYFEDLLIEDCTFIDFSTRTLFIESIVEVKSNCKIKNCTFNKCGNEYVSHNWNAACLDIYDVFKVEIENCRFNDCYVKSENDENIDGCIILLRNIKKYFISENNEVNNSVDKIKLYNC